MYFQLKIFDLIVVMYRTHYPGPDPAGSGSGRILIWKKSPDPGPVHHYLIVRTKHNAHLTTQSTHSWLITPICAVFKSA